MFLVNMLENSNKLLSKQGASALRQLTAGQAWHCQCFAMTVMSYQLCLMSTHVYAFRYELFFSI